MLNKTREVFLIVSFALVALLTSAHPVAAQNAYYAVYSPSGVYDLTMENDSGHPIYEVYFSPSGSNSWGSDRLGSTRVFHDGDSFTLSGISPNKYDLKFVFRSGVACEVYRVGIYEDEDVDLTAESLLRGCDYWR